MPKLPVSDMQNTSDQLAYLEIKENNKTYRKNKKN